MTPQRWGIFPDEKAVELARTTCAVVDTIVRTMCDERGRCFFVKVASPQWVELSCRHCQGVKMFNVWSSSVELRTAVIAWTQEHVASCFDRPTAGGMAWSEGA